MTDLYALLIGVDFYFEHRLREGGYYPKLNGCVRDISYVEIYLKDFLKPPATAITKLTISGVAEPLEPKELWPTYENMVAAFKQVAASAQPGDRVYIHYSGHGGRARTIYPALKGADGWDEALVPPDIGDPKKARYLRDVEIYSLLKAMVDKGIVLTVVLDSCHSGGATRALTGEVAGAMARSAIPANWVDPTPRPSESDVAPINELVAAWTRGAGGTARAVKVESAWLLEPTGYTLLAACGANESAYEYPFNGRETNGALTYWLLDTLRQATPDFTYKIVSDRVVARVHGQFHEQTPVLEGEGDLRVFGSDRIESQFAINVLSADAVGGRVRLNAGEAHGVTSGTQFAVYAFGVTDFARGQPIALVEVAQPEAVESWANIIEPKPQGVLQAGCSAVLLNATNIRLQSGAAVPIQDGALRQQVEATLKNEGKGFVAVAGPGQRVDFQIALNGQGELELQDPADKPFPQIPTVPAARANAASAIVKRAVHVAKYRNVMALEMPDVSMRQKLEVSLVGTPSGGATGRVRIFHPGDKAVLQIRNTQQPNPADPNDPRRILNITVLDLASDWSITQIYPAAAAAFEPLDPGKSIPLDLEAWLPEGKNESLDTLKVFATQATTNFRWLELPALDKPDTRPRATRSTITDPLEQMLSAITDQEARTREIRIAAPTADRGWTATQVEMRVQAYNPRLSSLGRTVNPTSVEHSYD